MHELSDPLHLMLDLHHSSISATGKRSREDIVTSLPSYTKLASPVLGAVQQCRALLLCPKPTLSAAYTAASSLQPQPGQEPLPAPQLTAKHVHKQIPPCHHQYRSQQHVRKSYLSTPDLSNPQFCPCPKYPNQFTAVYSTPHPPSMGRSCVKGTWPSHPFCFLYAQIQSCPTRRMLIMAALKHQCWPIFVSLNQR